MTRPSTVCFIGHRKIINTCELKPKVSITAENLIKYGVENFLFGDHSEFNSVCYDEVTFLRQKYPHIKRIHYRTSHREISDNVKQYFISGYEDSICPVGVELSGRAAYVERNQIMIQNSDICIFYYDNDYPLNRCKSTDFSISNCQSKSGTKIAFEYAENLGKTIINLADFKHIIL